MPTALPMHAPEKPRHGEPCNGCGYCCASEVCDVGRAMHGDVPAPCPSMAWGDGRLVCNAVRMADELGPVYSLALRLKMGVGLGCDSDDPPPPPPEPKKRKGK